MALLSVRELPDDVTGLLDARLGAELRERVARRYAVEWKALQVRRRCSHCNGEFSLLHEMGRWRCRAHAAAYEHLNAHVSGRSDGAWPCCGRQQYDPDDRTSYERAGITGCRRADHRIGTEDAVSDNEAFEMPLAIYLAMADHERPPRGSVLYVTVREADEFVAHEFDFGGSVGRGVEGGFELEFARALAVDSTENVAAEPAVCDLDALGPCAAAERMPTRIDLCSSTIAVRRAETLKTARLY